MYIHSAVTTLEMVRFVENGNSLLRKRTPLNLIIKKKRKRF